MTDNVTLNPGSSGAIIGADNISDVMFQRVKIVTGNDGVNDGDTSTTNPFPVQTPSVGPINRSGTIASTNVAQFLAPANPNRKKLRIRNESELTLWFSDITTAVVGPPSQRLSPWSTHLDVMPCSSSAISIIGIAGQSWSAQEY
jgi:hypothetical protein